MIARQPMNRDRETVNTELAPDAPAAPILPGDPMIAQLEQMLRDLLVAYEQLVSLAEIRRGALRRADAAQLGACVTQENLIVQTVTEIEKRRLRLVAEFADRLGSPEKGRTAMTWIGERCAEPLRGRVLATAQRLRERMQAYSTLNKSSQMAAEMLASHMQGLWAQVSQELSHSRTYSAQGRPAAGRAVITALDVGA